jgi:hypothetical protein
MQQAYIAHVIIIKSTGFPSHHKSHPCDIQDADTKRKFYMKLEYLIN